MALKLRILAFVFVSSAFGALAGNFISARRAISPADRVARAGNDSLHGLKFARPPVRVSLEDYRRASSALFGMPAATRPKQTPTTPKQAPAAKVDAPDPLGDFLFTGAVTIDGKEYALLENRKTREGEFVAVGDEFHGFRLSGIEKD